MAVSVRWFLYVLVANIIPHIQCQLITSGHNSNEPAIADVRIECNSNDIMVILKPSPGQTPLGFNGMVYPKGLAKNSSCLAEFSGQRSPLHYRLPLRSCNTMSTDVEDGVEYFNTVVVQPHRKLVTNQGRGYHIRCRYQTRDKLVLSNYNVSQLGTTPVTATAPMPGCSMKIFRGDPGEHLVAEHVKIGDPLTLHIALDEQAIYGLKVTDCLVRDGLGWGEQPLIDSNGCPVDQEIMGAMTYNEQKNAAFVRFQAHKFPYTASVYYQCNVRLCLHPADGCEDVPPVCHDAERRRRQIRATTAEVTEEPTIEVFSGLYVNEAGEVDEVDSSLTSDVEETAVSNSDKLCISQRQFAIGIAIAGLLLMLAVIAAILVLLSHRRRHRKGVSPPGSSIYSGPYTNTAYSHTS